MTGLKIVSSSNEAARDPAQPVVLFLSSGEQLGDSITRLAAYRAVRTALPNHRLIGVHRDKSVFLNALSLASPPILDEVHLSKKLGQGLRATRELIGSFGNVEYVFDHRSNGNSIISFLACLGTQRRYIANLASFMLRWRLPVTFEFRPPTNIERYHRMVEIAVGRLLPFNAALDGHADARAQAQRLLPDGGRFVGLAMGESYSGKFWGRENWTAFARHLVSRNITPVFTLGPAETEERTWIAADIPEALIVDVDSVESAAHLPWLFLAVAERAIAFVASEGGIGHLVATCGRPVLTIGGPTRLRRWRPVTRYHWSAWSQEFGSKRTGDVPVPLVIERLDEVLRFSDRFLGTSALSPAVLEPGELRLAN